MVSASCLFTGWWLKEEEKRQNAGSHWHRLRLWWERPLHRQFRGCRFPFARTHALLSALLIAVSFCLFLKLWIQSKRFFFISKIHDVLKFPVLGWKCSESWSLAPFCPHGLRLVTNSMYLSSHRDTLCSTSSYYILLLVDSKSVVMWSCHNSNKMKRTQGRYTNLSVFIFAILFCAVCKDKNLQNTLPGLSKFTVMFFYYYHFLGVQIPKNITFLANTANANISMKCIHVSRVRLAQCHFHCFYALVKGWCSSREITN